MLKPVIIRGRLVQPLPSAAEIRKLAKKNLTPWPSADRRTEISASLQALQKDFAAAKAPR
jgi:hypothetical protein